MRLKTVIAIALITLGIVVITYSDITFKTRVKPIDVPEVHSETNRRHIIHPMTKVVVLVGGIGLFVVYTKKK
ncbi:MAG: hypothetical protein JXA38_00465 [Methanosarcinaceae archaeon]|nr:hypothetical protein [Methanosarcinaceae archaeon]